MRDFAASRLFVEPALADDDEIGALECRRESAALGDRLGTRHQPCAPGRQAECRSTGGTRPRHAGGAAEHRGEACQVGIQQRDVVGRSTLLRPENRGRPGGAEQRVVHIAKHERALRRGDGRRQVSPRKRSQAAVSQCHGRADAIHQLRSKGDQRASAAIGRRTAADRQQQPLSATLEGRGDELAEAVSMGVEGLERGHQGEPACEGKLDYGSAIRQQQPLGLDRVAARAEHGARHPHGARHGCGECVERALATVGHGQLHQLVVRAHRGPATGDRGGGGLGRCRSFK